MALSKITNSGIGAIDTLTVDTDTLVVDSTNNRVGIGTASPNVELEISGSGEMLRLQSTDTNKCSIKGRGSAADRWLLGTVASNDSVTLQATSATGELLFKTGGTNERMRISSGGNLLVGKTAGSNTTKGFDINPSGEIASVITTAGGGQQNIFLNRQDTDGTAILFRRANGTVGSISVNSSSTSYNTSSDYRLKENVTADWDATTRLKQLNPVRFNFIADADTTVDGFLAHEVQDIVPEAISGTKDAVDADGNPVYQGIDQSKLVPLLVKTIQELEARIAVLENA